MGTSRGRMGSHLSPLTLHVFRAAQEEELVELLAQHCYVQLGASVRREAVQQLLPSCVPSKLYRTKTPEEWVSLVSATHAKVSLQSLGSLLGDGSLSVQRGWSPSL